MNSIKKCRFLNKILLTILFLFLGNYVFSQNKTYSIDISKSQKEIREGDLNLGGSDKDGNTIAVNNSYISYNNKPIIPVTGEFHFSRYPDKYWDESIKKMKAGGITMIATYIFWSLHEEKEGVFNWNGNRDVRKFISLCKANDMPVIIRIGPFCHGEIRNGGLPDWLISKPYSIRSNDPGYLEIVEKLYNEIGKQLKDLYFKDGGPLIATQIENEFQHSAAPWGLTYPDQPFDWTASDRDLGVTHVGVEVSKVANPYAEMGRDHMKILKALAIKAGIQTPLYTATGWGNAAIVEKGSLPVTAAYAYPTWTKGADISPFYLYTDMSKKPDYAPVSYNPQDYPVFPAELGSGIMSTYIRRPVVPAESMDALINRCLGSGANGLGYYMFHGGSTPKGEFFFNDEAFGYPKISYDFQAPIGEYGQVRPAFHRLKLIHFFLKDFGDLLAPMSLTLPEGNEKLKPEEVATLRYSVRADQNGRGFLFINNFQDDVITPDKNNLTVSIKTKNEVIDFPISIKTGDNAIYPFNLDVNGINLKYATAQLLVKGEDSATPYYAFFVHEGEQPVFVFSKSAGLKIKNSASTSILQTKNGWKVTASEKLNSEFVLELNGKKTRILILTNAMALKAYELEMESKKVLCFSDALAIQNKNDVEFLSLNHSDFNFSIYPKITFTPQITDGKLIRQKPESIFNDYSVSLPQVELKLDSNFTGSDKVQVKLPKLEKGLNDIFLNIDYIGDTGMAFINGVLVADDFYKGLNWNIGLKQFLSNGDYKEIQFYFRPIYATAPYLVDLKPASIPNFSKNKKVVDIRKVSLIPEYKTTVRFK